MRRLRDYDLLRPTRSCCGDSSSFLVSSLIRVLQTHKSSIHKVQLMNISFGGFSQELEELLQLLAEKDVSDLVLIHRPLPFAQQLPDQIQGCQSLDSLDLGFFCIPVMSHFGNLRELCLYHCVIPDSQLSALSDSAPQLKVLGLVLSREHPSTPLMACHSFAVAHTLRVAVLWMCKYDEVVVDGAPHLEKLLLNDSLCISNIQLVSAPVLEVLGFIDLSIHNLTINHTRIEVGMDSHAQPCVPSVKILGIRINMADDREVKLLPVILRCFPNIETLHIMVIYTLLMPFFAVCIIILLHKHA